MGDSTRTSPSGTSHPLSVVGLVTMAGAPITVRLATPQEGPLVQHLVAASGGPAWDWLDWSQVYPYWLIGEVNGIPQGTIMVCPGRPFGRMDYLAIAPGVPLRHRAQLCRDLSYAGIATCSRLGAQVVVSNIDMTDQVWKRIAEKRGWVATGEGTYMMKRCV